METFAKYMYSIINSLPRTHASTHTHTHTHKLAHMYENTVVPLNLKYIANFHILNQQKSLENNIFYMWVK